MTPDGLPADYIAGARFFHLSAIGQAISDSARQTCDAAIAAARAAGVKVSYDTNLRLRLWDLDTARRTIDATIARCDVALPSLDNSQQLTGLTEPDAIADYYLKLGAPLVALKMAAEGCPDRHARQALPPAGASRRGGRCHRRRRHVRRRLPGAAAGR